MSQSLICFCLETVPQVDILNGKNPLSLSWKYVLTKYYTVFAFSSIASKWQMKFFFLFVFHFHEKQIQNENEGLASFGFWFKTDLSVALGALVPN